LKSVGYIPKVGWDENSKGYKHGGGFFEGKSLRDLE
jgi:hypothetical protein